MFSRDRERVHWEQMGYWSFHSEGQSARDLGHEY